MQAQGVGSERSPLPARWQATPEVADALARGGPVVALESTILAHGFPAPENRDLADALEAAVRSEGAVPATIAIWRGAVHIGLPAAGLDAVCTTGSAAFAKASARDLGAHIARGGNAATTVASTALLAHRAGIRVFATGGIGGVHRGGHDSLDVSADLHVLGRTPIIVVSAGVKAVLDLPRTAEVLESLGVVALGLGTDTLPAFYCAGSDVPLQHRVATPAAAAAVLRASTACGHPGAVLLCNPPPADAALPRARVEAWIDRGLRELDAQGVRGPAITPALLAALERLSGGATRTTNRALAVANAQAAAKAAVAWACGRAPERAERALLRGA